MGGAGGAGGGLGGVGAVCTTNDVCRAGLYCQKVGCGPTDLLGKCADRPNDCEFDDAAVCGCDGITYLNVCLAQMNGQNVATQRGICPDGVALTCTPGDKTCEIRPNGVCGVIVPDHNSCPSSGSVIPGKCWVIASECFPTGVHYDSCDGQDKCIHTCDVVRDQKPYVPAPPTNCLQ